MNKWESKEKKDQKDFNATPTPASGARWFAPGDSKNQDFLIESKDTTKKSFSLSRNVWVKLWRQALGSKNSKGLPRLPILSIKFEKTFTEKEIEVVVLDKEDFLYLMEKI